MTICSHNTIFQLFCISGNILPIATKAHCNTAETYFIYIYYPTVRITYYYVLCTCIHLSSHGVGTDLTSQVSLNTRVNSCHLWILSNDFCLCHPSSFTQHCTTAAAANHFKCASIKSEKTSLMVDTHNIYNEGKVKVWHVPPGHQQGGHLP